MKKEKLDPNGGVFQTDVCVVKDSFRLIVASAGIEIPLL